jgi:DNA invertase Pin-like site-specific DNA recombinase
MVFGYIRVSTDKQDVESQKIGIVKKSQELGLAIDEWISDEGVSGITEYEKRKLGLLMKKAKDGDTIIVSEISRLARSVFMLFRIVEFCTQTNNIAIYSVKDNINVLKKGDMMSTMAICFFGISAQIEREMIVKRTKEGLERCKAEGIVLGRPIGGKNKRYKLQGRAKEIKGYIARGFTAYKIANILQCSKATLRNFMIHSHIDYKFKIQNKDVISKQTDIKKIFAQNENYIHELIDQGMNITSIWEKLDGKKHNISKDVFYRMVTENRDIYEHAKEKCHQMRMINNAKCKKSYFRYAC